jgi:hypothetical protein
MAYYTTDGKELGLTIKTIPGEGWEAAEARYRTPYAGSRDIEEVNVAGFEAELLTLSGTTRRPVASRSIIVEMEHGTVVMSVPSHGSAPEGGRDLNPLLDAETLLRVADNLQRYPD